ncbi:MAG: CheR family methyltransferase [Promethearchaeota archaeon]
MLKYPDQKKSIPRTVTLEKELVNEIKLILEQENRFPVKNYTDNFFRRRILVSMGKLRIKKLSDYITTLKSDKSTITYLIKELSINVTQFFRDASLWEYFSKELFPEIIKQKIKKKKKTLQIWCAGTASGQEPYSIAIIIHQILKCFNTQIKIDISGVDISEKALNYTKRGKYTSKEMEGVSNSIRMEYFKHDLEDDSYEVIDEIKKWISVKKLDLFSDTFPKNMDIIFCRNVIIYFNRELKRKLIQRFRNSLKIGGYLVIGMSESMSTEFRSTFRMVRLNERIFQKISPNSLPKKKVINNLKNKSSKNTENSSFKTRKFKDILEKMEEMPEDSKFNPLQKKLVAIFSVSLLKYYNVKENVLRGFIIRVFRDWSKKRNLTLVDFVKLPINEQMDEAKIIYENIGQKLLIINKKNSVDINSAKKSALKYLWSYLQPAT